MRCKFSGPSCQICAEVANPQAEPHPRLLVILIFIKKMSLSYRIPGKHVGVEIAIVRRGEINLFMPPCPIAESELEKPVSKSSQDVLDSARLASNSLRLRNHVASSFTLAPIV